MAYIESYSHMVEMTVPEASWDETWFAFQTWKGYLQSFEGLMETKLSAYPLENGDVRCYISTYWRYPEQLYAWLESEFSGEDFFEKISPSPYDLEHHILEVFS